MSQAQLDDYMARLKAETKIKAKDQIINSLIAITVGASLAYWAYGTIAHMVLFSFLIFIIVSVKNAVEQQMHQFRASIESKLLMDKLGM